MVMDAFEAALNGANFRDFRTGYRAFLDPDIFIDAQWLLEISKQVDGYVFSCYFHKDCPGRLRAGPLWYFNISLGNAGYATGDRATGRLFHIGQFRPAFARGGDQRFGCTLYRTRRDRILHDG